MVSKLITLSAITDNDEAFLSTKHSSPFVWVFWFYSAGDWTQRLAQLSKCSTTQPLLLLPVGIPQLSDAEFFEHIIWWKDNALLENGVK